MSNDAQRRSGHSKLVYDKDKDKRTIITVQSEEFKTAIAEAVAAERERCAKIAVGHTSPMFQEDGIHVAHSIARAIRDGDGKANSPPRQINIIFDGPPGPDGGRFVEVEDADGKSIRFGKWIELDGGMWALRFCVDGAPIDPEARSPQSD